MARKGMNQVAGIQCNTLLHPYFTLMCNSTTNKFNFIGSWILLMVVELPTKMKWGCWSVLCWMTVTFFIPYYCFPALTLFFFLKYSFSSLFAFFLLDKTADILFVLRCHFNNVIIRLQGMQVHNRLALLKNNVVEK